VPAFYCNRARQFAIRATAAAAEVMDQWVDIINAMIEALIHKDYELPAFSTLDNLAESAHAAAQQALFGRVE